MLVRCGADHLKGVHCVAVVGGVNFGVHNAETGRVKVTANTGKQIGRIGCVDQHLHAFTV